MNLLAQPSGRGLGRVRGEKVKLRDLSFPALLPLWVAIAYVTVFVVRFYLSHHALGADAHAYWLTAHRDELYRLAPTKQDAYLYSPAFAAVIWPVAVLPWPVFLTLWMLLEAAAFGWLLAPLGWRWAVPLLMLCSVEVILGDIAAFLAVAAVLGMRWPAAWAFPLLTKITPGLGPVWFAVRREWRAFGWAVAATCAVASLSWLIAPGEWTAWIRFLRDNRGGGTLFLPVRVGAAFVLTAFAAKRNKPWLLAPAMLLAAPVVHNAGVPTVLAAIPRLRARPA